MGIAIGKLSVILGASIAGFQSAFDKAEKRLDSFKGGVAKFAKGVGTAMVAAPVAVAGAATAAIGALGAFGWAQAGAIDSTAKLADRLGITTEALQGLRHAAELSGAGSANMDKALAKLSKGTAEAAMGTGEALSAFQALNLSIDDLMRMTPEQQLGVIADAMQGVTNANERARIAVKLFGDEGTALINTLAGGSAGLRAAQDEAVKLGVAFSRVDAAQVEAANDALFRMKQAVTGVAQRIAINLAPYIEFAATKLVEFGTQGEGAAGLVDTAFGYAAKGIGFALEWANKFAVALRQVWIWAQRFGLSMAEVARSALDGLAAVATYTPGISDSWRQGIADAASSMDQVVQRYGRGLRASLAEQQKQLDADANAVWNTDYQSKMKGFLDAARERAQVIADQAREQARFNALLTDEADIADKLMQKEKQTGGGSRADNRLVYAHTGEADAMAYAGRVGRQAQSEKIAKDQLNETKTTNRILNELRNEFRIIARQEFSLT